MVKINRIYTKTGDTGTTGLVGGGRVSKNDPRIELCGQVDEVNAWLGLCRTHSSTSKTGIESKLAILQSELFDLGAELATPPNSGWNSAVLDERHVERIEGWIDEITVQVPELRSFVLPGGNELNAILHIARTVCRRLERSMVVPFEQKLIRPVLFRYVNRLSDLLFACSRHELTAEGISEFLWVPGSSPVRTPTPCVKTSLPPKKPTHKRNPTVTKRKKR